MVDLGCQAEWFWNQLRDSPLGTLVRDFLGEVKRSGKTHPKCEQLLWRQTFEGEASSSARLLCALFIYGICKLSRLFLWLLPLLLLQMPPSPTDIGA